MNSSRCTAHGPNRHNFSPIVWGHIESAGRRHFNAVMEDAAGTMYHMVVSITKLPKRLRQSNLENRYCYMSRQGRIHLCECLYTKADDEEAKRLADELFAWLQPLADASHLAAERLATLAEKGREMFYECNPNRCLSPFNCVDVEKGTVTLQTYTPECGSAGNSIPAE